MSDSIKVKWPGANIYEDTTHRLVTDEQIERWDRIRELEDDEFWIELTPENIGEYTCTKEDPDGYWTDMGLADGTIFDSSSLPPGKYVIKLGLDKLTKMNSVSHPIFTWGSVGLNEYLNSDDDTKVYITGMFYDGTREDYVNLSKDEKDEIYANPVTSSNYSNTRFSTLNPVYLNYGIETNIFVFLCQFFGTELSLDNLCDAMDQTIACMPILHTSTELTDSGSFIITWFDSIYIDIYKRPFGVENNEYKLYRYIYPDIIMLDYQGCTNYEYNVELESFVECEMKGLPYITKQTYNGRRLVMVTDTISNDLIHREYLYYSDIMGYNNMNRWYVFHEGWHDYQTYNYISLCFPNSNRYSTDITPRGITSNFVTNLVVTSDSGGTTGSESSLDDHIVRTNLQIVSDCSLAAYGGLFATYTNLGQFTEENDENHVFIDVDAFKWNNVYEYNANAFGFIYGSILNAYRNKIQVTTDESHGALCIFENPTETIINIDIEGNIHGIGTNGLLNEYALDIVIDEDTTETYCNKEDIKIDLPSIIDNRINSSFLGYEITNLNEISVLKPGFIYSTDAANITGLPDGFDINVIGNQSYIKSFVTDGNNNPLNTISILIGEVKAISLPDTTYGNIVFKNTMFIQTIYDRTGSKFIRTIIRSDTDTSISIAYAETEWFKEEKVGCDLLNFVMGGNSLS